MIYLWLWCPCWYSQPSSIYTHGFTLSIYMYKDHLIPENFGSQPPTSHQEEKSICVFKHLSISLPWLELSICTMEALDFETVHPTAASTGWACAACCLRPLEAHRAYESIDERMPCLSCTGKHLIDKTKQRFTYELLPILNISFYSFCFVF